MVLEAIKLVETNRGTSVDRGPRMSAGTGQCLRAKGEENPAEEVEGEQSVRQEENQELLTSGRSRCVRSFQEAE